MARRRGQDREPEGDFTVGGAAAALEARFDLGDDEEDEDYDPRSQASRTLDEEDDPRNRRQRRQDQSREREDDEEDDPRARREDDEEDAEDREDDDPVLSNLEQLADVFDVDVEDLLDNLSHKVGDADVTLKDLVAGYAGADATNRYAQAHTQLAQESQQRLDNLDQAASVLASQFDGMEQMLTAQLQDPALAALRAEDPAAWTTRTQAIQNQVTTLRQARQAAADEYSQARAQELQARYQAEGRKLSMEIPGWNQEKLNEALETIRGFGFADNELGNIMDARLFKAALSYRALQAENKALKDAAKQGRQAARTVKKDKPRGLRPGRRRSQPRDNRGRYQRNSKQARQARQKLRETGNVRDAANVIEMMLD